MTEQMDLIESVMFNLHTPENIQNRVSEYYNNIVDSNFLGSAKLYELLSDCKSDFVKIFQIFTSQNQQEEIEHFVTHLKLSFCLPGDIILKQGGNNNKFYFIHEGLVEVAQHEEDFEFYDFVKTDAFFNPSHK